MPIGIPLSKTQLDSDMGQVAVELVRLLRQLDQLHELFLLHPDADFTGLGYTATEVATLKSAWNNDGPLLASIIRGQSTLGVAQDFRANICLMMGDGIA